jgi:hypothetical protein
MTLRKSDFFTGNFGKEKDFNKFAFTRKTGLQHVSVGVRRINLMFPGGLQRVGPSCSVLPPTVF